MVKIQIDLDDEENYLLDIYRAKNKLKSKERAVKAIIQLLKKNKI
jgi:hypothetical protein